MPIVHSHASISGHYTNSGCCSLLPPSMINPIAAFFSDTHALAHIYTHTKRHKNYLRGDVHQKNQV